MATHIEANDQLEDLSPSLAQEKKLTLLMVGMHYILAYINKGLIFFINTCLYYAYIFSLINKGLILYTNKGVIFFLGKNTNQSTKDKPIISII